jgi:hypothetical protein
VGEIGGTRPRPVDLRLARIKKGVHLVGKWQDFIGERTPQPADISLADGCEALAHCGERPQPHRYLGIGRRNQEQGDYGEIRQEIGGESLSGRGQIGGIKRHDPPYGFTAEACRKRDRPFDRKQFRAARSGDSMLMDRAVGKKIFGKHQLRIPERPRTEHRIAEIDLPVEARQGLNETRIGGLFGGNKRAVGRAVEPRHDLIEIDAELGGDAPLDVTFEEERQSESRQPDRRKDGNRAGDEQTQAKRAAAHPSPSAMT